MKRAVYGVVGVLALMTLTVSPTSAEDSGGSLAAKLIGFNEVPANLTTGTGTFTATVSASAISYRLTYSSLAAPATASHIHFAQPRVSGGIFAFLCGGGGKPACPPGGGTVTGTITAADVLGLPGQGLSAGDFAGALLIIRSGNAYVNVHTTRFPAGEIRGQVRTGEGDRNQD